MASSVFCMSSNPLHAAVIVRRLKDASFTDDDISVLLPDKSGSRDVAHERHTKAPQGATAGAGAGGVVGGTIGWLAGIGAIAIPGAGPFIAAGSILAALRGAAVGAAVGGIAGALAGMGVPEFEATRYEGKIREGGGLISVHCHDGNEVKLAREIFRNCDATDIATAAEAMAAFKANETRQRAAVIETRPATARYGGAAEPRPSPATRDPSRRTPATPR